MGGKLRKENYGSILYPRLVQVRVHDIKHCIICIEHTVIDHRAKDEYNWIVTRTHPEPPQY